MRAGALSGARVGVLREFFGTAPEDEPVAALVRQAIEDMKARGATPIDVVVPNLAQQLMASSLLTQELKFDLRDYLRRSRGARIKSLEELLSSGLHTAQFQGFVEGANNVADDYPSSADYRARMAARDALGRVVLAVMDEHKLDALVYPTVRRIAPIVGGNQAGSNAGLSAQTGFPAITVPAGFTAGGLPVGVELLGRPFAEPTLLGLAFAYESATRHRRAPGSTPPLTGVPRDFVAPAMSFEPAPGSVTFEVKVKGEATVKFAFDAGTRRLDYDVMPLAGARDRIGGVYLHRRANRPNGGVAYILAKAPALKSTGRLQLTEAEVSDLRACKFYVSAVESKNPLAGARGNLALPD